VSSCIGAIIFSNFSSCASWSDNQFMRGFIVKFLDKSIKMLLIAVLEPFIILVRKFTVLFKLYVANRASNCCLLMTMKIVNIYFLTDDKFHFFLYIVNLKETLISSGSSYNFQ